VGIRSLSEEEAEYLALPHIRIESGLSGITIDEKRFPHSGSHYISPDFAAAANKVEINIETGVSSVTIK